MDSRISFDGYMAGTIMEDPAVKKKRMIISFVISLICSVTIIIMRAESNHLFISIGGMACSVSDFFLLLPAALCGAQYGVSMFALIFVAEIIRYQGFADAYTLFIYIIIAIIPGYLAYRRWFKSFLKTMLMVLIVSIVMGGFWYITFIQLNTGESTFYEVMGPATIFISAIPETFAAFFLVYLFFRFVPDGIKKYIGYGFVYTKSYDAFAESDMGKATSNIGRKLLIISITEATILSFAAAAFSHRQMRDMPNRRLSEITDIADSAGFVPDESRIILMNIQLIMLIMCVALPIAMIFNELLQRIIVRPLTMLSAGLESYTDNDEMRHAAMETIKRIPAKSDDEIRALKNSLLTMLKRMDEYVETLKREEELKVELKAAEARSEAKSTFLSSMSHEIRTPINAVLGMNELIIRESNEETTLEYAENIRVAGNTLLNLVNDILDFSKIEAGKMDIIEEEYESFSAIHDLISMVSGRAEGKGLKLITKVDPELPSMLYGDEIRLKQVVTNILTNAVKYTEEGSVTLTVSFEKKDEDHIDLFVSVKDTGIGIKKEDIGKLTREFERIEEERNRNIEGTGLGMNITTRLLNLMGSELKVNSVYGKGSDFYFHLEQRVVNWAPIGDVNKKWKESVKKRTKYHSKFTAPDARILSVDDVKMNLHVFAGLLKPTGVKIDCAESGAECLDMITKNHYDIIFLDHRMPEMDGVETRQRMKDLEGNLNIDTPVIALTANAQAGARDEYVGLGFTDYLTKPVDASELENMVEKYLPEDMVKPYSGPVSEEEGNPDDYDTDDLPAVDGMDISFAKLHLPSRDLLETSVTDFYNVIDAHADRLEEMYSQIPGSFDEYRIQVHGMKSSAAIIGIIPLAGAAKILEDAAGAKDETTLRDIHGVFIRLWRSYRQRLSLMPFIATADNEPKKEFDRSVVLALLDIIRNAMADFDVDKADEALDKLSGYDLKEPLSLKLSELKSAVSDVDDETTGRIAGEMMDLIGG